MNTLCSSALMIYKFLNKMRFSFHTGACQRNKLSTPDVSVDVRASEYAELMLCALIGWSGCRLEILE